MSYSQDLGMPGGTVTPRVMKKAFRHVLMMKGEEVQLYHKPQIVNCPCWNEVFNNPDPDCDICNGTGKVSGFTAEPSAAFKACVFLYPEVRQDQHQELRTKMGPMQTLDGRMYYEGRWYDSTKVGDVIVYKTRGRITGIELRVTSKVPRTANNGEIIFVRSDLERQPMAEVQGSSVRETL